MEKTSRRRLGGVAVVARALLARPRGTRGLAARACNVTPIRYGPGTLASPDGRSLIPHGTRLYFAVERGLQSSGLCIFTHLLHMLAMTPTPGIINVCGGAAHSTIMSVSGALLLISVLSFNSIPMVSMYLVINLLLQCACDLSGIPLPLKGERVSSSVFTTHSVFALSLIHI